MAIKFQYNKTSLTALGKQLGMRRSALPTLKNKESALRTSVQTEKMRTQQLEENLEKKKKDGTFLDALWNEFEPGLLKITNIKLDTVKVAGVKVPQLSEIEYEMSDFNAFAAPAWYADGVQILKDLTKLGLEAQVAQKRREILEHSRKKTTQKVNLYEKVQIPGYEEAIRKIKRYMEDEENLSKASSKIVKTRHAVEEEEERQA